MEFLIVFIFVLFAIFGLSEFLHIIKLRIIFPKARVDSQLVIKLKNDIAEKQTLYICEQFCWYGKKFADSLRFNCEDIDEEVYERCRCITKKYGIKI